MNYQEIFSELQNQLLTGRWKAGQRLPSERELSEYYGVSRPTVSRALNRLRDAGMLRRLTGAGTFVLGEDSSIGAKHQTFGLMVPGLGRGEIFEPICARIAEKSRQYDFTLIWGGIPTDDEIDHEEHLLAAAERLVDSAVKGVFFQPLEREPQALKKNLKVVDIFERARIPITLLDSDYLSFPDRSGHDLVGIDNVEAAYVLTNHFLGLGRQRVDFVWPPNAAGTCLRRRIGFQHALARAGIDFRPEFEHEGDPQSTDFAQTLFKDGGRDIVCLNDETAVFLMRTFEKLGLQSPHDIRIAGFDDLKFARLAPVPLTTMKQPCQALGDIALRTMIDRVNDPWLPPRTVTARATLCVRESTG